MNNFWTKFNNTRVEKLSKKLVFYNRKNNINAIENNHYNHIRDIYLTLIATESFKKKINILDYDSNIITISNIKNKINCQRIKFDIYDPNYEKKIYGKNIKINSDNTIKSDRTLNTSRSDLNYVVSNHYNMLDELKNFKL